MNKVNILPFENVHMFMQNTIHIQCFDSLCWDVERNVTSEMVLRKTPYIGESAGRCRKIQFPNSNNSKIFAKIVPPLASIMGNNPKDFIKTPLNIYPQEKFSTSLNFLKIFHGENLSNLSLDRPPTGCPGYIFHSLRAYNSKTKPY